MTRSIKTRAGVLTATAGAAMLACATAYGQAGTPQLVTVTGIRGAIESAISVKKNADSIVEAISAEDIGKLPDASIAESIARLPGVAAQRVGGKASAISVRGFAPEFATSLLNGREQVSTGDNRYVEYDQYPSELLGGLTIYKTPDGALVGQGLSATVDMQSIRPLDSAGRVFAVNYRKQLLNKGLSTPSGDGYRFNAAYIDQFADRTLGLALGLVRLHETSGKTTRFESWGANDVCPVSNVNNECPTATLGRAPGGFNDFLNTSEQTRDAFMGTLQYKPNKSFSSTLDVYVTKFDATQLDQGLQMPLAPRFPEWGQNYGGTTVTPIATANGVITSGSIAGFKALSRNDVKAQHDKVRSIGWNNRLGGLGDWTATLDLATNKAEREAPNLETTAGLAGNCKTTPELCGSVSWTGFDGNDVLSARYTLPYDLANPATSRLTDVEGWGGGPSLPQAGYSKVANTEDKLNAVRLSAKRDLPEGLFFADMDVGVNFADREKTRTYVEGRLVLAGTTDPFASAAMPGGTPAVAPASGIGFLTWNPDGSIGPIYTIAPKLVRDIANKNWTVSEKVTTAFVKLGVDNTLFGLPVRGNAGVQVVRTQQESTAFSVDGQACPGDVCPLSSNTAGTSYYDVLPNVNLATDLGGGQTLRLGVGRQMARPTLNDMRASLEFSRNQSAGGYVGNAGNPALKPFRANYLDLSYEKYWANKAYVSAAAFYKDLSSYIVRAPGEFDYTPYVTSATPPSCTTPPCSNVGILTRPINGKGGSVKGLELAASMPFGQFVPMLEGFGVQASYAYTDSSVTLPISGLNTANIARLNIPLPGLSKNVSSVVLYFEKAGFEARVGTRYRSDFIGNIKDEIGDNQLVFVKGERITDAQLGYNFTSGPLKGLSLMAQVTNMGNTPYVEFRDSSNDESKRVTYGKNYLFGLAYKY